MDSAQAWIDAARVAECEATLDEADRAWLEIRQPSRRMIEFRAHMDAAVRHIRQAHVVLDR